MKWSALIAQTSSVRFALSEMILKNCVTRCGCLCLCCHVVSSLTYSGRQTHPASEGVNLHGALEGEETGEGGVHVVQDELVGVSLMVVLDDVATLINFSSSRLISLYTKELPTCTLPSSSAAVCWGRWATWWSTRRGWTRRPSTACIWSCPSPWACISPGAWLGLRSQYKLSKVLNSG